MNRRLTALTLTAVALFGLTACTGAPAADSSGSSSTPSASAGESSGDAAAGGQTVAEACNEVTTIVQDATADVQQLDPNDPVAASAALRGLADGIAQAAGNVTNPEISALLPDLQTGFQSAADAMDAVAAGDTARAAELQTTVGGLQEAFTEFGEACGQG